MENVDAVAPFLAEFVHRFFAIESGITTETFSHYIDTQRFVLRDGQEKNGL